MPAELAESEARVGAGRRTFGRIYCLVGAAVTGAAELCLLSSGPGRLCTEGVPRARLKTTASISLMTFCCMTSL